MSVWKLGCRWGTGRPPIFFDFLLANKCVISGGDNVYAPRDVILLTDGHRARGVASVVSQGTPAQRNSKYEELFTKYQVEEGILAFEAKVYALEQEDQFDYPLQQGIVQIRTNDYVQRTLRLIEKYMGSKEMNEIVKLVQQKKQVILQGAPGVGKTYATKEVALRILGESIPAERTTLNQKYQEAVKRGQIVFVTFHQSLDYEDFIEGYKPKETVNGQPSFELRDGPFKSIVAACYYGREEEEKFENAWAQFFETFEGKTSLPFKTVSKGTQFYLRVTDNNALRVGLKADEDGQYAITKQQIKDLILHEKVQTYNVSYVRGVAEHLRTTYNLKAHANDATRKPHVLIIDEINRGNVSKIFGELITLLEADKREADPSSKDESETISAKLTYSQDDFTIPYNLFIVGTMNTADRSLGQIDYALRRRFAFCTIKSNKGALSKYYQSRPEAPGTQAIAMFERVHGFFKNENGRGHYLNPDFDAEDIMVGHSYFMAPTQEALLTKFRSELLPLVEEYRKDGIITCPKEDEAFKKLLADMRGNRADE